MAARALIREEVLDTLEGLTLEQAERVIDAELCRQSFADFLQQGWHVLHPGGELIWGWHMDAITEHLEALWERIIRRLALCFPPGFAKSMIGAVFYPAWCWLQDATHQWLYASHKLTLTLRDAQRFRNLIESSWYQSLFTPEWSFQRDQKAKGHMENTEHGARYSVSVGGGNTGWRGHTRVIDDAMDAKDASRFSSSTREKVVVWYEDVWSSRKVRGSSVPDGELVIGQRLHEGDIVGHLEEKGRHEILALPNQFDPARRFYSSIGWTDPRKEKGELLCEELLSAEETAELEENPEVNEAQYNQNPTPEKGLVFQRDWFKFYTDRPLTDSLRKKGVVELPSRFDCEETSWDFSFGSETESASDCAGIHGGRKGANLYLLGEDCEKRGWHSQKAIMRSFCGSRRQCSRHYVEGKANGPALIAELRGVIPGLISVNPDRWGDKIARARAASGTVEAGNVYIPWPEHHPWITPWLNDICAFPKGKRRDRVDAFVQLILKGRDGYTLYV